METIDAELFKKMVIRAGENVIENEPYLTEIDEIIGDGDHGTGMKRGFTCVIKKLEGKEYSYIDDVANDVGLELIKSMGGASGVVFGSLFIGGLRGFKEKNIESMGLKQFVIFLTCGEEAITTRGKAQIGDKTMIDALTPAVSDISEFADTSSDIVEGLKVAYSGSLVGVEKTKNMIAKKGRAKSFNNKNLGIPDPGAVSTSLLMRGFYEEALDSKEEGMNINGCK